MTEYIEEGVVQGQLELCAEIEKELKKRYGEERPGFYIQTLGCQQNEADSERMAGLATLMGYRYVTDPEDARLIFINTCAIREHAEIRALSFIGEYKHIKDAHPDTIIGVGGCMVTQQHRADRIKNSYPYVSFTFDTGALHLLPELVYGAINKKNRRFVISEKYEIAENIPTFRAEPFKSWLSIMYGCNNFCSYCIVPYVRGRERSRTPEAVISEARELVKNGAKDITLLGQNVNSYGKDTGGMGIAELMREICRIEGDFRLRFMTSHPKDASDDLIEVMATEEKVVPHFHLPVQSGSNRILEAMNRRYTAEKYMSIIEKLKNSVPDVSITSDIIVGFPGETEEDFLATLKMLEEVRYDMVFSFIYSPRVGTPAAKMENQIDHKVASERLNRLMKLQDTISLERNERFVGKVLRVLTENVSKNNASMMTGKADAPRPIHFAGDSSMIGEYKNILITSADKYSLTGEIKE
ncbi:MAG: tRNA (N6-isopentenyl adenosine(37)-C2)-methylthiotransferase MiaB [Clostridia bacterium]|nr:tRNA (N6-isopentenyl adenosine(37)-C2)-methylthiotransferase MiaB [Clostridia bacterium]